ncbi:MAG: tRNA adenosine(34) deaminase TadA [Oscillospiraceae bacterium]|nr:tRNA adenosine(34) deaminase TadA [Oscillospiraceae bacterium]
MTDEDYMREALLLAKKAFDMGEVPVGAVAVWDGEIVGRGMNLRETDKNALRHAEIMAIDEACKKLGGWRLWKCDLYVTLEPCPMCAGAIINSRVKRVIYGAADKKAGSCGSLTNLFEMPYNHKPELISGVLEEECSALLSDFFAKLREKRKNKNPSE